MTVIPIVSLRLVREGQARYEGAIDGPQAALKIAMDLLADRDREFFLSIHLDTKLKLLSAEISAIGTANACLVSPAVVFRAALLAGATSIIFAHCHPSGDPAPSTEDIELTRALIRAGNVLGIRVLDHIVIGNGEHVSLRESLPHLPWNCSD